MSAQEHPGSSARGLTQGLIPASTRPLALCSRFRARPRLPQVAGTVGWVGISRRTGLTQFDLTFPVFVHYGIELWVPEIGGKVDPGSDAHDLVMSLYGGMSKGERNRIKVRVRSAMTAQAQHEGRFLGGRPPYGYQMADAGAHPNPGKAADGKRLHQLEVDPSAAPVVERIFAEYIAGKGYFTIAEGLTRDGIPSPSAHDPARNRHRDKRSWSKIAVRSILMNPRYTGRQVWNRQRRDDILVDVEDVAQGHLSRMRWNDDSDWI